MAKERILVTGGTGFLGKRVVVLLLKKGYDVTILARGKSIPRSSSLRVMKGDLLRPHSFAKKMKKFAAIVHLAANVDIQYSLAHPSEVIRDNVSMLVNLLEALRLSGKRPLIIFASTDRLYGKTCARTADEDTAPYPIDPYTASKILGEQILELYRHLFGMPYVVLRIDSIYGPGQPDRMFISDVIQKMQRGLPVHVGRLGVRKNFVYVDDVAQAILRALRAKPKAHNTVYNIGGAHVSLQKVLGILQAMSERKLQRRADITIASSLSRPSAAEVNPFRLSTKKALRALGWKPTVSLESGLRKTIDYFLHS